MNISNLVYVTLNIKLSQLGSLAGAHLLNINAGCSRISSLGIEILLGVKV